MIADDHTLVRAGLSALLRQEPDFQIIAEASNGMEAIQLWNESEPDIALIDLSMPDTGGLEAIRRIREAHPLALIIVLSSFAGDEDVYSALRAGAKGYLLKHCDPVELCTAIRAVWGGKTYVPGDLAGKLADRLSADALTGRELEILQLVAAGMANKLIGRSLGISEGTVKTHIKNILNKLDATSRTEASAIAQKRGFVHL